MTLLGSSERSRSALPACAEVHVSTFTALLADTSPDAVDVHVVDTELLVDARLRGIDDGIRARLSDRLREVASHHPDVILCSCSTLSSTAERLAPKVDCPVVRIDRPMAERAVAMGGRIALVVAVESTLEPTRALFEESAAAIGGSTTLIDAPCLDAWELFERGNLSAYFDRLARHGPTRCVSIDRARCCLETSRATATLECPRRSSARGRRSARAAMPRRTASFRLVAVRGSPRRA